MTKGPLPPPTPPPGSDGRLPPQEPERWEGQIAVDVCTPGRGKSSNRHPSSANVYPHGVHQVVIVNIPGGKPRFWLEMDPTEARKLAERLIAASANLEPPG